MEKLKFLTGKQSKLCAGIMRLKIIMNEGIVENIT